nr:hypothetical protein [Deltaproteobacteria bacterium]
MRQLYALVQIAVVVGCGGEPDVLEPDAAIVTPPDFEIGCTEMPQSGPEAFTAATDFGPVTPGTLAGWDADGRWFFTGARVGGVSSVHLERRGDQVVVDRDDDTLGTIDNDAVFHRYEAGGDDSSFIIAKRVIDRRDDGSLRVDRAVCDGEMCRVCTARVIRATRNGDEVEGDKLSLVGELYGDDWDDGFTFNVRVVGTLAYLIRQDGLHIIETADPANPVELGRWCRTGDG